MTFFRFSANVRKFMYSFFDKLLQPNSKLLVELD